MNLNTLQRIANGTDSLAEIEQQSPVIGAQLKSFVMRLNDDCRRAYERLSDCLDAVLGLREGADPAEREAVIERLNSAGSSDWFKNVAGICDDLAALANRYGGDIETQARALSLQSPEKGSTLYDLLHILHQHEGELKYEIRQNVDGLKIMITDGKIGEAREEALRTKDEIDRLLTRVNGVTNRIVGSGTGGAGEVLKREVAAEALRRPERALMLNMAFVLVLLSLGMVVLLNVSFLAFIGLAAFILAAVVILNAVYLRSIDRLKEENFVGLVRLALLNFFAPLARRAS